jgi:hypothetical protein
MGQWAPVESMPIQSSPPQWTLKEPRQRGLRLWQAKVARADLPWVPTLVVAVFAAVVFSSVVSDVAGVAVLLLIPGLITFHTLWARAQAERRLGPRWRKPELSDKDFRDLPESYRKTAANIAAALHGIWSSRAAKENWITRPTLEQAHVAAWQALHRLLDAAPLRELLRESSTFDELSDLVTVRSKELAALQSSVEQVARQLMDAHDRVRELDNTLEQAAAQQQRERRLSELEAELSGRAPSGMASVPAQWQDTLDAVQASVEGALAVLNLGPGRSGGAR